MDDWQKMHTELKAQFIQSRAEVKALRQIIENQRAIHETERAQLDTMIKKLQSKVEECDECKKKQKKPPQFVG